MRRGMFIGVALAGAMAGHVCAACSPSENDDATPSADGGADIGHSEGGPTGVGLRPFTPPQDPGGGGVLFAASGELLALTGYAFPPASPDDVAFVDGWDVKFSRLLVTVDGITLSDTPDVQAGDPSKTGGELARASGPWAIDLSRSDPSYLPGKGGPGEQAVPIAALAKKSDGSSFATDGTRYAFGFDVVAATRAAMNVNLDTASVADYQIMVAEGCAVLYVGTATFKGNKNDAACYPADRQGWPDEVDFRLCFKSPTTYVNCQNPDNTGAAFPNEEHQRGIALLSDKSVIGQVTIHTDHPFWDSVIHDSPAHFDQFAARVVQATQDGGAGGDAGETSTGTSSVTPIVTLDTIKGVDYTNYTDALGRAISWRYCVEPPTDAHPKLTGPMRFDPQSVPHAVGGNPASGLRDYYDFSTYDQSTQGHLNGDGLCFVKRSYPSPN